MSDVTRLIARAREIMAFSEDAQVIGELTRELEKAQPRIITTVEELDALPDESVIRDSDPAVCEKEHGRWYVPRLTGHYRDIEITLPATVLFDPKEETK